MSTTSVTRRETPDIADLEPVKSRVQAVSIPRMEIARMLLPIQGTTPLIVHKWSEKSLQEMLDKQRGKARQKKAPKDPEQAYQDSLYRLEDGSYGFPAIAFKMAAVRAGTYADEKMTYLRGAFHVDGKLVPIAGEPTRREDVVRIMSGADIHYRGEFEEWSADLPITYNTRAITPEQLANLFNIAGFAVGVGEWRPERGGQNGQWTVLV